MRPILFKKFLKPLRLFTFTILCLLVEESKAAKGTIYLQQTDSLEQLLTQAGEEEKQLILEELIVRYLPHNPKLALQKSRQALTLSLNLNNSKARIFALMQVGNSLRYLLADYDSALYYCQQALLLSQQQGLLQDQVITLLTIGDIYQEQGNSYKAIEYFMQAQVLAESLRLYPEVTEALNRTGQVFARIGNENKAIEYHTKALQLSETQHYLQGIGDSHFHLGNAYQHKGNLSMAFLKYELAAEIRRQLNDLAGLAHCELAQGTIYLAQTEYTKAETSLEKGLSLFKQLGLMSEQAKTYNIIGKLQTEKKEYSQALNYLQAALQIGELKNDKKIIRDSYENLYACHAALKDYETALKYKDLFVAISDFIYGEESERRMAELQTYLDVAEKEREIEVLKKDKQLRELALQKQANFRDFLITGMVLLLVILLLIVYLYRNKRQSNQQLQQTNSTIKEQNQKLQELNATKDKFFGIISHDLKSPLNSLTAFSSLLINHADALSREEIQMLATDLDKSLKNLISLLENLLEWSRTQTNNLELKPEPLLLRALISSNIELLQKMADNKGIQIHMKVPATLVTYAGKNQLNTVMRNLISNALKFTNPGGSVSISALEKNGALEVSVEDTGVGISAEVLEKLFRIDYKHSSPGTANEKGTGLGLMLCKEFIEQNKGTLNVESKEGAGSVFRFSIPKAAVEIENPVATT